MIEIYTDGSCDNLNFKYGSSAFVILENNLLIYEDVKFYQDTTNNRTETQAAINALNWLKFNYGSSDYILYSDSQLLVNTVMNWSFKWKANGWRRKNNNNVMNLDLVKEIHDLYLLHKGKFKWIKGHSGNKWNEYCDQLCRESDEYNIDKVLI